MERTLGSLGVVVVVVALGYFTLFMKRDSVGEDYRLLAREMVAEVDGYSARPDYYDWLVDFAHDEVFSNATSFERTGRRRTKIVVDEDKYMRDIFYAMVKRAREDNATGVVAALEKYQLGMSSPEPAPKTPPPSVQRRR